ncbi:MAG: hypothetical protein ACPG7F_15885 [Aggregatilineales bacterium]
MSNKKREIFLMFFIISLFLSGFIASISYSDSSISGSDGQIFSNLLCNGQSNIGSGGSWNGIIIGETHTSKIRDISNVVHIEVSDYQGSFKVDQYSINFCHNNNIVTALSIKKDALSEPDWQLPALVSNYGMPDAISQSLAAPDHYILYWFKEGIVAEVFGAIIDSNNITGGTGTFVTLMLIPYEDDVSGFEDRWPYKYALVPDSFDVEEVLTIFSNPSYLATMTAYPSSTLTATPIVRIVPETTITNTRP